MCGLGPGALAITLETFPNSTPQPTDTINDIMFRSGQQSVIEFIKQEFTDKEN